MTRPTKSFFLLSSFAVLAAVAAMTAYNFQGRLQPVGSYASSLPKTVVDTPPKNAVDSSTEVFADSDNGITLKYPKSWALYSGTENKFFYINLFPEGAVQPITIYIGPEYYGFKGLKTTPIRINNYSGEQVDGTLLGLRNDTRFYTFDLSNNIGFEPQFKQLLNEVQLY